MEVLDFSLVPNGWAVCPGSACPTAAGCLRHVAYESMPDGVTQWESVMPRQALKEGACRYFCESGLVRMARGFDGMFAQVKSKDAQMSLRLRLTEYFGSNGTYYRYRRGERLLTPQQQQQVLGLFRQYGGIGQEQPFDSYVDSYNFKR